MSQVLGGSLAAHGLLRPGVALLVAPVADITHGADPEVLRPAADLVRWTGSVMPDNPELNDTWTMVRPHRTSNYTFDGEYWVSDEHGGKSKPGPEMQLEFEVNANTEVLIPLAVNVNVTIDWGDGTVTSHTSNFPSHTYVDAGTYAVAVSGSAESLGGTSSPDDRWTGPLRGMSALGRLGVNLIYAWTNCTSLTTFDASGWDVSSVTNLHAAWNHCTSLTTLEVSDWDVSSVTSLSMAWSYCTLTTLEVSGWDVSSVTNLSMAWTNCTSLTTLEVSGWDVSSVTSLQSAWQNCSSLTELDIGGWDVSSVTNMQSMFSGSSFNQPISNWNVSSVANMSAMFANSPFDQPIDNWNVSSVTSMWGMFSVTPFNQPIGNWQTQNCVTMANMFNSNSSFNQPISNWNVSSVTDMQNMFRSCPFNQPVGNWDVSSVTKMLAMFQESQFNQPIGDWDVSSVTTMHSMFRDGYLSNANYDHLLNGWSQLTLQSNVPLHAGNAKYTAAAARAVLTDTFNWTITDGGEKIPVVAILDLDASALTGLSDGDPVNTWPDNSGLGNDLTGASPTYRTNMVNGLPVVRFDGVDDMLSRAALFVAGGTSELTIFTVFVPRGYRVGAPYFHVLAAQGVWANTTEFLHSIDSRNAEGPILATSGSNNDFRAGEDAYLSDVPVLLTALGKPGSQQMFTNGALFATGSLATFDPRGSATFYVAGDTDGRYFMGDIAQMVVYNGALSTAEREAKQTDLMTKWGI